MPRTRRDSRARGILFLGCELARKEFLPYGSPTHCEKVPGIQGFDAQEDNEGIPGGVSRLRRLEEGVCRLQSVCMGR